MTPKLRQSFGALVKAALGRASPFKRRAQPASKMADELAIDKLTLNEPTASGLGIDDPETKKSTTFLNLTPKLRQKILVDSYDVESDSSPEVRDLTSHLGYDEGEIHPYAWSFVEHKHLIHAWTAMLRKVDASADFNQDVDVVKQKWLEKLLTVRRRNEVFIEMTRPTHISPDDAWRMNREGPAPWKRVHNHLDEVKNVKSRIVKGQIPELKGSPAAVIERAIMRPRANQWNRGPSRINWHKRGVNHPPSTWNSLNEAADKDIEWVTKKLQEFYNSLPESFIKSRLPSKFSSLG
ncbi:hypothetical protein FKW77_009560 [Venturia effusa]|uniref:Uncharacterized protein n=1 Tax=Venturia effusa TaxID=50376 RepID=A0A517LET0_9PEZI|nr:hypothetical protein FKW77_009560 [Venturia effusa]